jgi:hypothetical protein
MRKGPRGDDQVLVGDWLKLRVTRGLLREDRINHMEEGMRKLLVFAVLFAVGALSVTAQTATPRVTKRQVQQQARIKQGVKSGELTAKETRKLERQQAKIAIDKAKAKSDGVVTPAERKKLNREQNRASRRIYRQKHDAQVRK